MMATTLAVVTVNHAALELATWAPPLCRCARRTFTTIAARAASAGKMVMEEILVIDDDNDPMWMRIVLG